MFKFFAITALVAIAAGLTVYQFSPASFSRPERCRDSTFMNSLVCNRHSQTTEAVIFLGPRKLGAHTFQPYECISFRLPDGIQFKVEVSTTFNGAPSSTSATVDTSMASTTTTYIINYNGFSMTSTSLSNPNSLDYVYLNGFSSPTIGFQVYNVSSNDLVWDRTLIGDTSIPNGVLSEDLRYNVKTTNMNGGAVAWKNDTYLKYCASRSNVALLNTPNGIVVNSHFVLLSDASSAFTHVFITLFACVVFAMVALF